MPPARPRVDDSRSDASSVMNLQKDRATLGGGISKSKKNGTNTNIDTLSTLKTAAVNGALAATNATVPHAGDIEAPQVCSNGSPAHTQHCPILVMLHDCCLQTLLLDRLDLDTDTSTAYLSCRLQDIHSSLLHKTTCRLNLQFVRTC